MKHYRMNAAKKTVMGDQGTTVVGQHTFYTSTIQVDRYKDSEVMLFQVWPKDWIQNGC